MEIVRSAQNPKIKLLKSLSQKKYRDETGLYLVEGANILRDMPQTNEVEFFAVDEDKAEAFSHITSRFDAEVIRVQSGVLDAACGTVSPQGIAAAVKLPALSFSLPEANALMLDSISDSGNLGAVIRTAAAADFLDVYLLDCADAYSPKAVRASMGGIFRVRCAEISEKQAEQVLKNSRSFALDMDGAPIFGAALRTPMVFLCGGEARGIRNKLKSACSQTVSLPMKNGMESLNAAVALSIAMYMATNKG